MVGTAQTKESMSYILSDKMTALCNLTKSLDNNNLETRELVSDLPDFENTINSRIHIIHKINYFHIRF